MWWQSIDPDNSDDDDSDDGHVPLTAGPRNNPNNSYTRAEARRLSKLLNPDLNNNLKIRKFSCFNCPNLISLLTPGKEL